MRSTFCAALVVLAGCSSPPNLVASGQLGNITVSGDDVYWAASGGASADSSGVTLDPGAVIRVPLSGGSPVTIASLLGNLGGITAMGTCVYVTGIHENDSALMESTLTHVPMAGGSTTALFTATERVTNTTSVATDANNVYWVVDDDAAGSTILSMPLAGGQATTLVGGSSSEFFGGLISDGSSLYWTVLPIGGSGRIMKLPVTGGTAETIADGQANPVGLAVDASSVYWTNTVIGAGTVVKAPVGGGTPVTLATNQRGPASIAVDDQSIYWGNTAMNENVAGNLGAIVKLPLAGGTTVTLVAGLADPASIALTNTDVFWSDFDGLKMISKNPVP